MINASKIVRAKSVVDWVLVSVNLRSLLSFFGDNREQSHSLGIGYCVSFNASGFSFNNTDNGGFILCLTSSLALALPAEIRFINFNFPTYRINIFRKHHADLLAHSPGRFVSNSRLSLNLLGRNTTSGLSHQVDSIEPGRKRCSGFVKDCVSRWGNLVSAMFASINFPVFDAVVLGFPSAALALVFFRPAPMPKPIKTNIISWEVVQKLFECVFIHDYSITGVLRVVKV